jgi:general secretion pathway protein D
VIGPSVADVDETSTTLESFNLAPRSVRSALDVIARQTGLKWRVRNGVVELLSSDAPVGKVYTVPYEVRDIVLGVRSKPGPDLKLKTGAEEVPFFGEDEPAPTVVEEGFLIDLITQGIAADSWDEIGTINFSQGVLTVRNTRDVHTRIESLLADLRRAVGIQIDIESRFLRVADNFLEDVGVDFRGLGDQSASGLPGRGLERPVPVPNAGFDDFGQTATINVANPNGPGTGTEPGFYFNDGQDGAYASRTENLFDQALGGTSNLDNSGGLSLQYAWLDDVEVEAVLRAVSKQERAEELTAPRLLVYNNARANLSAVRQTSYIKDFDVEIAQAAAIANPVVDVVRDGVVLDVKPVVSADRRFITMELRPSVLTLQLPIPTFTTTLGTGQPVSIQIPTVTLQRVRTTVTMPDGATLMLGGMKMAERTRQKSGIPILKDIPIISFFFSRTGTFIQNEKILILVRASIVLNEEYYPTVPDEGFDEVLLSSR